MGSFTDVQMSMILGTLLGDGSLRRQSPNRNALLEVNHSLRAKEYVDWKYNILKDFVSTAPKSRNGNGNRIAYRFTTRSLESFTCLYEKFYKNKRKTVPDDLFLDPLLLAVWFMDDGSKSRSSVYLNTQQFSIEEQHHLLSLLYSQYGITGTLNKDKIYFRLRVCTASTKPFKNIIAPYIHPFFTYKMR